MVIYHKRFLLWWGLGLFLCKLSSRRQLDFQFNTDGPALLDNLNRLAGTRQTSRPVNKTLDNFLGHIGTKPVVGLRARMMHRLIRMRALDSARLQGRFVLPVDGSGYLVFRYQHCPYCLKQRHGETTLYMHQVLEAKLLGPAQTVLSLGTEFIDNRDLQGADADVSSDKVKQDCELKALRRLAAGIRQEHPQLRLCFSGDSLDACGEGFQIAKDYHFSFVYVFKEGRLPALWAEFQTLLKLCPERCVETWTAGPRRIHRVYRWVNDLLYSDSDGRTWKLNAIQCEETLEDGTVRRWAWLTDLEVNHKTVVAVATEGGRHRWRIENQGFNTQKNSGLNMEHAYSHQEHWAAYYYLLQIAHILLQLVEKGSLLRQLAQQQGKRSAVELYGSLENVARRLLESLRLLRWPEEVFATGVRRQVRLDSS
jgi:hypothetical protein